MLKKLQLKFVLINMLLVGTVLLAGLSILTYDTYQRTDMEIKQALSSSISYVQNQNNINYPSLGSMPVNPRDGLNNRIPTYTVTLNSAGYIINTYEHLYSLDNDDLIHSVRKVKAFNTVTGKVNKTRVFYTMVKTDNYTYISFASTSWMTSPLKASIFSGLGMFSVIMFCIFVISLILARQSLKPVKRAWRQQQQFVSDASHELKTPLTVILTNNNIIQSNSDKTVKELEKWVTSTEIEAGHMNKLIENLLFLARTDETGRNLPMEKFSLSDILLEETLQFEPIAFERGIDLKSSIDEEIPVKANHTMIKQLVHILMDNAFKYTEQGGSVFLGSSMTDSKISVTVQNTGDPIDPDDLPNIFERFYRSSKSRTHSDEARSYGLGLSIAKAIIKNHNGTIKATSNSVEGTKMVFTLPKVK